MEKKKEIAAAKKRRARLLAELIRTLLLTERVQRALAFQIHFSAEKDLLQFEKEKYLPQCQR